MAVQKFKRGGKWVTLEKAQALRNPVEPEPIVVSKGPVINEELETLKRECDEKGIKYHHASGVKKLQELLASPPII